MLIMSTGLASCIVGSPLLRRLLALEVDAEALQAYASVGNGPNKVSESTVSNTELSEFFGSH